ncbi:UxaA family hydrolase [Mameliella alba]|nr:UxaA family hydrolase [Mameliella alba]MCA0956812.1 UxaA family hydrolase [Mameliella alba]
MTEALCLRPGDDVANVLDHVAAGDRVTVLPERLALTAAQEIPQFHKLALRDLPAGTIVRRNGIAIGKTTQAVAAGTHVHVHNLRSLRARPRTDRKDM